MKYYHIHADLMINLTSNLQPNEYGISKFDVIPFIGFGFINNSSATPGYLQADGTSTDNKPFALNYGVELRYRLLTDCTLSVKLAVFQPCVTLTV